MTQELKPCPFCGGGVEYFELSWTATAFSGHMYASPFWQIRCKDCRATLGDFDTKNEAIAAWNTRAERTCEAKLCCDGFYRCTECGHSMLPSSNYCPHCGAKVVE